MPSDLGRKIGTVCFYAFLLVILICFCLQVKCIWQALSSGSRLAEDIPNRQSSIQMQSSHTTSSMREAMWRALKLSPEEAIIALNNLRKADEATFTAALYADPWLRKAIESLLDSVRRSRAEREKKHRREYV